MGAAAVAGMLVGAPAHAAPTPPDRIPDTGARPLPAGPVPLPGGAAAGAPVGGAPAPDSLVTRLTQAEADVTRLGQQVTQATLDRDQAAHEVATLTAAVRAARAALATARRTGQVAAESAYKSAAGVPEEILDSDLRGIGALTGRSRGPDGGVAGGLLARAAATADAAEAALTDARTRHRAAAGRLAEAGTRLRAAERALGDLRRRDPVRTSTVERQRDRRDASVGRGTWQDAADLTAHPKVRAVLAYALRQVGKPYALNAEGPDRFDCSGLTMMAYRAAGFALPRVAAPQYAATADKRVDPKRLVPGDLLFFNLTVDPADIHHVALYLGRGRMVHAPQPGRAVEVTGVTWSTFFAATRVFAAAATPAAEPPTARPTKPWKPRPPTAKPTMPDMPDGDDSGGGKPGDGNAGGGKPGGKPGGDKPGGDKPGGDKPGGGSGDDSDGPAGTPTPTPTPSATPTPTVLPSATAAASARAYGYVPTRAGAKIWP